MDVLKKIVSFYAFKLFRNKLECSKTIGLGTGSTVKYFVDLFINEKLYRDRDIVVSSTDTLYYLLKKGVEAYTPNSYGFDEKIDFYIDGFDEVSRNLDMVKGRGGAFHWEKILARNAVLRVYIGDYTKYNERRYLYLKPIPIEVSKNSFFETWYQLVEEGYRPRIRMGKAKDGPVITDSGNYVIDLYIYKIVSIDDFERKLYSIKGVIDTGLFSSKLVDYVLISDRDGSIRIYSKPKDDSR